MRFDKGIIRFNKIYILQSLLEEDKKTGTELHNDVIERRSWNNPSFKTELIEINNKQDLLSAFEKIIFECSQEAVLPFIHFETHGFREGISLSSFEKVYWRDILPILRNINFLSKNNLFVSVAACQGGNIQRIVSILEPCPFRGFIGPMADIGETDLLISYTGFFNELLMSGSFDSAINRLNSTNFSGVEYHYMNSEAFFELLIDYPNKISEAERTEYLQRIDKMVYDLWENNQDFRSHFSTLEEFKNYASEIEKTEIPLKKEKIRKRFLHL